MLLQGQQKRTISLGIKFGNAWHQTQPDWLKKVFGIENQTDEMRLICKVWQFSYMNIRCENWREPMTVKKFINGTPTSLILKSTNNKI